MDRAGRSALLAACAAALVASVRACPGADWHAFGGMCYWLSPYPFFYHPTVALCNHTLAGATPVSVHDAALNAFLADSLAAGEPAWIGLSRTQQAFDVFTWADGSEVDWLNWAPGEPADQQLALCVALNHNATAGRWGARWCYDELHFFCQTEDEERL